VNEIVMPRIDAAMQSGRILEWLRKENDAVVKGEPIVLVEGEKTTFEIEAPGSGILLKIIGQSGSDIPVGEIVGILGEAGEKIPDQIGVQIHPLQPSPSQETSSPARQPELQSREIRASPAARALARQHGIDLAEVIGTGPHGRVQTEDVLKVVERKKTVPQMRAAVGLKVKETIPLEGIRKTVAERLAYSFRSTVPVMVTMEADMEALKEARDKTGETVSVTTFVVKAVALALRQHAILNSSLEDDSIKVYDDINIAVAIDTPRGLTAPVIFGPEKLSLAAISKRISDLREMAISGTLSIHELTGGTFTVTNLGSEGVELFAPIINPPQAAILAVGQTIRKPVALGESIKIRPRAILSLIFDHRIIDGVPAAKFLNNVRGLLENPRSLMEQSG